MFIGHFGVALAAKKVSPKNSLGTLFLASQLLDLVWPVAAVLGLEKAAINHSLPTFNALDLVYAPYSHSLGMSLIWAALFGFIFWAAGSSRRTALILAAVVFSHWLLDFVTHIPDLPLWFGETKLGLGLWKSLWGTFVVESAIFALGILLYLKSDHSGIQKKKWSFWSLILFLSSFYLTHMFGPKPPETNSTLVVAAPAFAMWLLIFWAHYADKKAH